VALLGVGCVGPSEPAIEGGEVNDAQAQSGAVLLWQVHDARLGLLILQFNLVAHEGDGLAHGLIGGARGNERQATRVPFGPRINFTASDSGMSTMSTGF
jgi:hypothetical protein